MHRERNSPGSCGGSAAIVPRRVASRSEGRWRLEREPLAERNGVAPQGAHRPPESPHPLAITFRGRESTRSERAVGRFPVGLALPTPIDDGEARRVCGRPRDRPADAFLACPASLCDSPCRGKLEGSSSRGRRRKGTRRGSRWRGLCASGAPPETRGERVNAPLTSTSPAAGEPRRHHILIVRESQTASDGKAPGLVCPANAHDPTQARVRTHVRDGERAPPC